MHFYSCLKRAGSQTFPFISMCTVYFMSISEGQWQWLMSISVMTLIPALVFVLIELFRDTRPDGTNERKPRLENMIEGGVFFVLVLAWIPSVGVATTPGGVASLIGNAYFFTWILIVFMFEGLVWWIHDYRLEVHQALREKAHEYRDHQRKVIEKTRTILGGTPARGAEDEEESESEDHEIGLSGFRDHDDGDTGAEDDLHDEPGFYEPEEDLNVPADGFEDAGLTEHSAFEDNFNHDGFNAPEELDQFIEENARGGGLGHEPIAIATAVPTYEVSPYMAPTVPHSYYASPHTPVVTNYYAPAYSLGHEVDEFHDAVEGHRLSI